MLWRVGAFSIVPTQCAVCASINYYLWLFYYPYIAAPVAVRRVKCACQQIYLVFVPNNAKQEMACSLSLQARVQMSNISSSNPIWYDNSK